MSISLFAPSTFEEIEVISKTIMRGNVALVNMQKMQRAEVQRMLDFLTGIVYVSDGKICMISDRIIVVAFKAAMLEGTITLTA